MELRAYWSIIWRRIWIVALIVGVVALYAAYQYYHLRKTPGALKTYQSQVVMLIGLQANSNVLSHGSYSDYVSVSESVADEFTTGPELQSSAFDTLVSQQITTDMSQIQQHFHTTNLNLGNVQDPGAIGGALSASRYHSLVTISTTWNTPQGAWAISNAVGEVTAAHIDQYIDYVVSINSSTPGSSGRAVVAAKVVNSATDAATIAGPAANKPTLLLVLVLVALIIGIALAFLIDYLDDRIRSRDDVVQLLQVPVFGEVPRTPSPGHEKSRRVPAA